jgi:hypothetical protein
LELAKEGHGDNQPKRGVPSGVYPILLRPRTGAANAANREAPQTHLQNVVKVIPPPSASAHEVKATEAEIVQLGLNRKGNERNNPEPAHDDNWYEIHPVR